MAAMEGYHSSVFLYGQTGTGKTYTMQVGWLTRHFGLEVTLVDLLNRLFVLNTCLCAGRSRRPRHHPVRRAGYL